MSRGAPGQLEYISSVLPARYVFHVCLSALTVKVSKLEEIHLIKELLPVAGHFATKLYFKTSTCFCPVPVLSRWERRLRWLASGMFPKGGFLVKVAQSCLTLCDPMNCSLPGSSVHGESPGKKTGVGFHALLQGIFPTQGLNPGLPHCRQILHHLSH